MSKSGQAFVAATDGSQFTLYAVMKALGIPLSKEQKNFQAYLERAYPPMGGSDPDPEPGPEVRCNRCHWEGRVNQLKKVYVPNPKELGDVVPELGCPACFSDGWLEFKEQL